MFKAITFDYWQTLYADTQENWEKRQVVRIDNFHEHLTEQGYSCKKDDIAVGLDDAYKVSMTCWYEHKGVSVEKCLMAFAESLELSFDETEIAALIVCLGNAFMAAPPVLIAHVKPMLESLSEKYALGIISDSALSPGKYARKLMERDGIYQYFSAFTFSDETEHTKPEVVQFISTLEQLNAKPIEAVHVGDIVRTDIVGAKNAKMKAIRFAGFNKSETDDTLSDAVIDDYRHLEDTIAVLSK